MNEEKTTNSDTLEDIRQNYHIASLVILERKQQRCKSKPKLG